MTLGFGSGLPFLLTHGTLSLWLAEEDVPLDVIGWVTMVSLPYSLKFLWAPALDNRQAPWVPLGRRRGWMALTQGACALSMAGMALCGAKGWIAGLVVCALLLAVCSASQDVVVDAYRVERLPQASQGTGAALAILGYRVGMWVAGAGAFYLAYFLNGWPAVYALMALCMGIPLWATFLGSEPDPPEVSKPAAATLSQRLWEPLKGLLTRPDWLLIILFIMSFKLGDSLANRLLMPFLRQLGFGKVDLANIANTFGIIMSIVGALVGGLLVRRLGTIKTLWIGGILQAASNLVFVWQAHVGPDPWALVATISAENLSGGLGAAAFVAYLSALCDRHYTATQYALLTAASSIILTLVGGQSGVMADALGWSNYFMLTTLLALPGLGLLAWLTLRRQNPEIQ